MKEPNKK